MKRNPGAPSARKTPRSDREWHIIWCPHPHCNRFTFTTRPREYDAMVLIEHRKDCDGLRYEREIDATEARMRLEGRWARVARRWGLPAEEP